MYIVYIYIYIISENCFLCPFSPSTTSSHHVLSHSATRDMINNFNDSLHQVYRSQECKKRHILYYWDRVQTYLLHSSNRFGRCYPERQYVCMSVPHEMFGSEYHANVDRYGKHCCCQQIVSRIRPFHWHNYISLWHILKVKVRVMQTANVNISQTVTIRVNFAFPTNTKCHATFSFAYSKGLVQGQARFDCEYLANGKRYGYHYCFRQIWSHIWSFDWHIWIWSLLILMDKVKTVHISLKCSQIGSIWPLPCNMKSHMSFLFRIFRFNLKPF